MPKTDIRRKRLNKVKEQIVKSSTRLFWCLFFIYTSNIIGKTSFSAATVALIDEAVLTKTQAGLISGVFWLIYAVGQFVGGFLANKMSPYKMMNITIVGSALSNLLMACTEEFVPMLLIWSIGSVAQFGMWPSVLKFLSTEIIPKQRPLAMGRLAFCYCIGSVASYIFTAGILVILSWKYIFLCCGVLTAISFVVSLYAERKISPHLKQEEVQTVASGRREKLTWQMIWSSGLIFFCVMMVIKSIADTGIKNWMPTIMMETYGASPSYTSLLSVVLLVTNVFGVVICTYIYERVRSDELKTLLVLYIAAIPMLLLLLNFENMNIFIVTLLMSVITILIYGSGQILQMNYPGRFNRFGLTATVGGIINSFAAIGNVIATYGSGYVADHFGWNAMIGIWNVLIILFVVIAIAILPIWKKFRRKQI